MTADPETSGWECPVSYAEWRVAKQLLADGASNARIAIRLSCAEDTVKSHLRKLLQRTGTRTRTEFVVAVLGGEIRLRPVPSVHGSVQ